ncbi:MAG TPA: ATP-binding protein [Chitinophagaceae bacterium]
MQKGRSAISLLFAILFISLRLPVFGQLKYEWLTTSNGLSQGYVYDILQDKDGFMWFGTKDGLNRYDGYNFKVYTHDSYNPNSISNNTINQLFEDSKGRIWVGTDNGINIYDKNRDNFRSILHDPKNNNSLSGNKIIMPIIELVDGRFLVTAFEKGLNIISLPNNFLNTNESPSIVRLVAPEANSTEHIYKDSRGKVWLIADKKLYEFDPGDMSIAGRRNNVNFNQSAVNEDGSLWTNDVFFSQIQDTSLYPLFNKDVAKGHGTFFLHEKDKSMFWLGITDLGKLQAYDTRSWKRGSPIDPEKSKIQDEAGITVKKFYKDRSGLLWMATNGYGLRKYSNGSDKFLHFTNGLSIRKIEPFQNDQFYIRGWGEVRRLDVNGNNLSTREDQQLNDQQAFLVAKNNTVWFLHKKFGEKTNPLTEVLENVDPVTKKTKTYKFTVDILKELIEPTMEDRKGNIWISGAGGNLLVFHPATGQHKMISINTDAANPMLNSAAITALFEDASGVFWVGTETGLVRLTYNPSSTEQPDVTWYRTNPKNRTALSYSHVTSIVDDAFDRSILWVATKGGGLNRLDKTSNQFSHITTKDGLCNNVVYGLLADNAGNIWGSTNKGIFCLMTTSDNRAASYRFRSFTKADGLQDDEFNTGAFAKLPDGTLAFGGVNGLNVFNPATVLQSEFNPNVFITNILVGNKVISANDNTGVLHQTIEQTSSITLNHLQDIITLEFTALDFSAPGQNKYRYQLVGIDKDWVESGTRRTATYLHLPAGNYVFKVQGSNSQGMWNDKIKELKIYVLPPWWRTWWAYVVYALLIGFAARAYFLFRVNKAKLQSQLHYEQQEAKRVKELDTLKTQLYANITHEFRTPLTVIMGMAHQVRSNPEEHLDNGMDMIVRNGQHLLNLVNEMLDLSKLEDGKMTLHLVNGDVINFLRYIVESFQSLAAGQQKQFHFLSDTDELIVAYDAEKLRQIITNLLSNALKFTPALGNVYVSVSQEPAIEAGYTTLVLKVKDTGIGIPENQVQHIFDRFYQIDNSHTRKAEGTGIGLALTKELVRLMNGTIAVKSPAVGATKGTEFTITLQLQKVNTENVAVSASALTKESAIAPVPIRKGPVIINNEHAVPAAPLILLVEDNVDVVAYTASCLPQYKLAVGKDGKEGFDIATEMIPDLIITDVMMPFIDGFEMCRKLKQDERTSHIPVIMLTAKADMQSKLEGLERGADVYLEKPFHKEELLLRIKKLLELRQNLQQYYSKQIGITQNAESVLTDELITATIEEPAEHEFVKKVREVVEANFTNYEFSIEQLCKLVFMSHSQLHRKLEALTGCSPNKFIRIVRLNKAKELLDNPIVSIADIALDCGYNDPGYFSRVFKQEYGVTPQDWRVRKPQ